MSLGVVVPCYNEQDRLDVPELVRFSRMPGVMALFVDDGSTDRTVELLNTIVWESGGAASLMRLPVNSGKGEAVRRGLVEVLGRGASVVGFADADLATPVNEINRLSSVVHNTAADAVLGSRVRLAGRTVERTARRHYLGRFIATYIGLRTDLPVYDTQCGTKFFLASKELRLALSTPFRTRWLFDVELLRRLHHEHTRTGRPLRLREEPLESWIDAADTHLRGRELIRVVRDFARLERGLRDVAVEQGLYDVSAPVLGLTESHEKLPGRAIA